MEMLREYDFDVTPFAGGEVERVSIMTEYRALGFTLAALQATDPSNVWKVRLVRDNGRELDPYDVEEWRVPAEYKSRNVRPFQELGELRTYEVTFTLFGLAEAREFPSVIGRPNVFTVAAIDSSTPDAIMETELTMVSKTSGDNPAGGYMINKDKKYGGVTVDLGDPLGTLVPVPAPATGIL